MDLSSFLAIAAVCAPLVDPSTSQAVVDAESNFNANAIGVVGGSLQRQPRDRGEALATAKALVEAGRNFSVGLAQINVHNLAPLGLTLTDAFDGCENLRAMQQILAKCFARATQVARPEDSQAALRHALSCYYSGNLTSGIRDGYVRRVVHAATQVGRRSPP